LRDGVEGHIIHRDAVHNDTIRDTSIATKAGDGREPIGIVSSALRAGAGGPLRLAMPSEPTTPTQK